MTMTERTKHITLDDFFERIGTPAMKRHHAEIKRGGVTLERIREMAREIIPDIPDGEKEPSKEG